MTDAEFITELRRVHAVIFGKSGAGKSWFLLQCADALAKDSLGGFTFVCPHGSARLCAERLSNPARAAGRVVHVLDFNSDMIWGGNPFETYNDSWEECHTASLLWTSSVASLYATAMQNTPRLETTCYVLGMFAAAKKISLNDLLPAISLAGDRIREFLLSNFDNHAVRGPLEDLHILASKNPRLFLELLESFRNRTVRWLGDKRLARFLGKQKGLDAKAVMDGKEIVLIDLSSLEADDAAFVMTLIQCRYFAAAKRRVPDVSPPHTFIVDEAASSICTATAQMLDQTRKFGLFCLLSLQRIGQLEEKSEFILESVMVNAGAKIVFNMPEPRTARLLAETIFLPYLNYAEWKKGSERPTAVGNELRTVRSRSHAHHQADHVGAASVDMTSAARSTASSFADISAWGSGVAQGDSTSWASTPPDHLFMTSVPLSRNTGRNAAQSRQISGGRSAARSFASMAARTRGTTQSRAHAEGSSVAEGESETFVTIYQDLPTQLYSVDDQLTRLTGEIMGLQPRECFVKLPYRQPFRTRTKDLPPAYRSLELRQHMLPRFLAAAAAQSPYVAPAAVVDAEILARAERIAAPSPAPPVDAVPPRNSPMLNNAFAIADDFIRSTPPARKKKDLRVIDGGAGDAGDKS